MEYYLYILAFHVMSVISWMAMLFYQPRLYVYHAEHKQNGSCFTDVIKIQEQKLYKYIGIPAFWASFFSGLLMIYLNPSLLDTKWLWIKLSAVVLLIAFHFYLGVILKKMQNDSCTKSGKFFRVINEIPTILMIIIVSMVVAKPF